MDFSKIFIPCEDRGGYRKFGWFDNKLPIKDRWFHMGSDRNCPAGSPVFPLLPGKVIYSGEVDGFGSMGRSGGVVIIESKFDNDLYSILYGHIVRSVAVGEIVNDDEVIGNVIRYVTADYRADHLHWGVYKGGGIPKSKNWGYLKDIDTNWIDPDQFREIVLIRKNKAV